MNFVPSKEDLYVVLTRTFQFKHYTRHIPTKRKIRNYYKDGDVIKIVRWERSDWEAYKKLMNGAPRPKQWNHWLGSLGFYSHGRWQRREHQLTYFKGHGYVWRINDMNMLQCGDCHEEFDRWALCSIVETPVPKTRKEFEQKINALLEVKRQIEAGEMDKPEYGSIVVD